MTDSSDGVPAYNSSGSSDVPAQADFPAARFTRGRAAGLDLPEAEGLYRLLVESVDTYAIFALDPAGHILSWNRGAQRIKGYKADEIIGQHFSIFYPEERIAEGFPQTELEVADREGRFEDEGWRIRKDGTRFWANVIITALRDETGALIGFTKVTRDLTERREAEAGRLADAERVAAAEAANQAKSEFLATLSHELRTPLNAIGGYVSLISDGVYGPVTETQQKALHRIRQSQEHLLTIVTDLLNYSAIEAGRVRYESIPVPVVEILDTVAAMTEPQALSKGVSFERRPCPASTIARTDRARVEQILINLLSNALRFTPPGGQITLSCTHRNGHIAVEVRDTGPGVPADKLDSIFEPFVQLGRELNRPREGVGLGLAISRDLARALGGEVTAENAPETGAVFTLLLPAGREPTDEGRPLHEP